MAKVGHCGTSVFDVCSAAWGHRFGWVGQRIKGGVDMMDGASLHGMAVGCGQARWLAVSNGPAGVSSALVCVWRCGLRGGIYLAV